MSEQKMREALTYIAGLASADDARDLPTIAATAQEALAQPADVGLTYNEIARVCVGVYGLTADIEWHMDFARAVIQAHETKKKENHHDRTE